MHDCAREMMLFIMLREEGGKRRGRETEERKGCGKGDERRELRNESRGEAEKGERPGRGGGEDWRRGKRMNRKRGKRED